MSVKVQDYYSDDDNTSGEGLLDQQAEPTNDATMDDNSHSLTEYNSAATVDQVYDHKLYDTFTSLMHSNGLFESLDDIYETSYRLNYLCPGNNLKNTKEILFFTKPDLNIYPISDTNGISFSNELNEVLQTDPFWLEMASKYVPVIKLLEATMSKKDPFNHLLQNMVMSNLDIPSLSAETVETPNNSYGVGYSYRGSSEAGNDTFDFSLEFRDTKFLPVYHFFKAYEEYETLKHHGTIRPCMKYITDKVLHDQYSIYKFLLDEDMETIVYYAKFYGVMSKSLPRDVFSTQTFDNGLSYSIDFRAAFFEDMKPNILTDFNALSKDYYDSMPYQVDVHNNILDRPDNRGVKAAYIIKETSIYAPGGYVYKLKWKGDSEI